MPSAIEKLKLSENHRVDLKETKSSHLKAYGAVPEAVKNKLDPALERLMALLEEMVEGVEGK